MSTATIFASTLLALPFFPEAYAATSEVRPMADFQSVEFRGAGQLTVAAGQASSVTVTTDAGALSDITTTVRHGVLVIERKGSSWHATPGSVEVAVSLPTLRRLTLTGATQAEVAGLAGGRTTLVTTGASRLRVQGSVDALVTQVEGASQVDLTRLTAGSIDLDVGAAAQVALPARTPLAGSRDSVGSLTNADRMDRRMQSTLGGSRILR
jgi:uncharacterized protein YjlB